ncbi:uncharacterized protein VP01_93g3 [Puccinia sorghi]|uniref:Uncharacterized protein n=1 Tax=Puccinia sorghi TaxID=27349 RepID=A0A0L6U782_9BASI|nr:uncharacterized protein VP01_93g3 [Puccinia sorghi]
MFYDFWPINTKTYLVITHGIPKTFNPSAPNSIKKLRLENNFVDGSLICVKWLADNSDLPKQSGSLMSDFYYSYTSSHSSKKK